MKLKLGKWIGLIYALICVFFCLYFYMLLVASTYSTEISKCYAVVWSLSCQKFCKKVLYSTDFQYYFVNSLYVAVFNIIITVIVCLMCGYGVAKYQFKLKKFLTFSLFLRL